MWSLKALVDLCAASLIGVAGGSLFDQEKCARSAARGRVQCPIDPISDDGTPEVARPAAERIVLSCETTRWE
jgi:hypothetical protein